MEPEELNVISANITIVSSIVAIAAVSICSILTAVITQRGARKSKQTELIFHEMVTAYYNSIEAFDAFSYSYDLEYSDNLAAPLARALLFASEDTRKLLSEYAQMITAESVRRRVFPSSEPISEKEDMRKVSVAMKMSACRQKLLDSMQKDLRE
ncbi:hypothetical protein [Oscillibacter sp.]|uniref:hypothetical protein n=1 Tax=Oscillibacter sp. TaxID=1945593 RepID=UPI00289844C7|nr:hypothetical protein [Oscillibacter sp.]